MRRVTVEVHSDFPVDVATLWDELSQIEHHIRWMADAQSIEFAGSQRTGVGTVFNCATRIGPFVTHDLLAITEWEHMARIGVQHKGEVRRGLSRQGVRCGSMEPWPVMFSAVS